MANKGNISTRGGDKGKTSVGGGGRVDKDDARIEAVGTLDEVNSTLGYLRSKLPPNHDWNKGIQRIQTEMMNLMGHAATPSDSPRKPKIDLPTEAVAWMEQWMEDIEATLSSETNCFLLPGGNEISALCHVVRTQVRRAERRLVTLHKQDPLDPSILQFVNRLSDLAFKWSRQEMERSNVSEERWRLFIDRSARGEK